MMWFFAILLVLALGAVGWVAAGRGTPMARAYDDRPDVMLPAERALTGDDLRRVRFGVVLRGYRMGEVDALLERLAGQLEEAEGMPPGPRDGTVRDEPARGDDAR